MHTTSSAFMVWKEEKEKRGVNGDRCVSFILGIMNSSCRFWKCLVESGISPADDSGCHFCGSSTLPALYQLSRQVTSDSKSTHTH